MAAEQNMPLLVGIARKVIRWIVVFAILAIAAWFGFMFLGRILCRNAISQIAELTNTRIDTASVDFRNNGSVFIKELVITADETAESAQPILTAQNIRAQFSPGSLLRLRPSLRQIDVNDFVFNAQYDVDTNRWNLSSLKLNFPKTSDRKKMPTIRLQKGVLQYTKLAAGQVKTAASIPLTAKLWADQNAYSFDFKTATQAGGFGESHLTGSWEPGLLKIAGGIASADVPELDMAWTIDTMAAVLTYDRNENFTLDARIKDLRSRTSPELGRFALMGPGFIEKSTPFAALQRFFKRYSPSGHVDINFKAAGNLNELRKSTLTGTVNCKDVAVSYYKFKYPVKNLKGPIGFTRNGITLNNLIGNHGDVELAFNGWTKGFAPDWKYDIKVTSEKMTLDEDLYNALSAGRKKLWEAYSPVGSAAINYSFTRTSPQSRTEQLILDLQGIDAVYRDFPYPLENLKGGISFEAGKDDNVIISNVVSEFEGKKIMLNGKVTRRADAERGYEISIDVNNIPLDSEFHAALPKEQKDLYDQFSPDGILDGRINVSMAPQPGAAQTFTADLLLREGVLKSDHLPLPMTDVTAGAIFTPDQITIKKFAGRYADNAVSLKGTIWPGQNDQPARYDLALEFKDTALGEDLFDLLPESAAKIVADLKPRGKINLTADLSKLDPEQNSNYKFIIDCLGNTINPTRFSYPLQDITGAVVVTPQMVEFQNLAAAPSDSVWMKADTSAIELNGTVTLDEKSFGEAVLDVNATDIFFDEALGSILPNSIKLLCDRFVLPSRFDLDLDKLTISSPDDNGSRLIDAEGILNLDRCSTMISGAKTEINGPITIAARYRTNHGFDQCSLSLGRQNLEILGKTFTNVTARVDYDSRLNKWATDNLAADCYGGKLTGRLELSKNASGAINYTLQTGFENVDLKKFLSDTKMKSDQGQDRTTGKMQGTLNIGAILGDSNSRIGTCKLSIVDMRVGRVSPLAKLLQVLRFAEPAEFAFDKMYVDSYIKRDHLLVKKLDLSGESAAFYGSGIMDLETQKIDLELIARGKRLATAEASLFGSLAEGLGQAVVKVDVIGDFYDPQVITRPLPFIKGALDILGSPIEPK
ncbi:MAG: AsmA-like C-terminal domain-containing protein [Sedimentisphaerales bacterium]|nr:AsmA-like C-terminal domain-containing protein [Sedimentisphaerales bacterium]